MQRLDSQANLDFCREQMTNVDPEVMKKANRVKLTVNSLMTSLHQDYQGAHPEVQRLLYNALSALEAGSMWAVKAMTSEFYKGNKAASKPEMDT
jgi:hypothetical protein